MAERRSIMPVDPLDLKLIFPFPASSTAEATAFSLRSDDMRKCVLRRPDETAEFLRQAPMIAFGGVTPRAGFSAQVKRFLEQRLDIEGRVPTQAAVCDFAAISQATLYRRLRDEDLSFQALRDQVLNDRAKGLLEKSDATIAVIAEWLGFSEDRSFRRSFYRWNGCTPLEYRRSH